MKSKLLFLGFLTLINTAFAYDFEDQLIENNVAGCITKLSMLRCHIGYAPARLKNRCLVCVKLVKPRAPKSPYPPIPKNPTCGYGTDDADCNGCSDWDNNCPNPRH